MQESLTNILNGLKSLAPLGANAVHRRALSIVRAEINAQAGERIEPLCDQEPWPPPYQRMERKEESLSFSEVYHEYRHDDRRRSIFLDPIESLAAHFVDYYTDRVDALEFRHTKGDDAKIAAAAREMAIEHLRNNNALVSVLHVAARNRREVIDSLRSLAHQLETTARAEAAEFKGIGLLGREICTLIKTETSGAPVWFDNGKTLKQMSRDVYSCIDSDACCPNEAYTKYGNWDLRVIWVDDGNIMHSPPIPPPPFVQFPWDNHCPVFPAPVAGTVTSDFGWRQYPAGQTDFHPGMDIAAPAGTPVLAPVGGTIVYLKRAGANFNYGVIILTGNQVRTYWHIDPAANVQDGQVIAAGTLIGTIADQGNASHLHFALNNTSDWQDRRAANAADPCP